MWKGPSTGATDRSLTRRPPLLAREPPRRAGNPLTRPENASTDVTRARVLPEPASTPYAALSRRLVDVHEPEVRQASDSAAQVAT
jgi:hypothetical protein